MPGLKGGSKRQIRDSLESAMFSLAAAARSCAIFLFDNAAVARPRKERATQVSESFTQDDLRIIGMWEVAKGAA